MEIRHGPHTTRSNHEIVAIFLFIAIPPSDSCTFPNVIYAIYANLRHLRQFTHNHFGKPATSLPSLPLSLTLPLCLSYLAALNDTLPYIAMTLCMYIMSLGDTVVILLPRLLHQVLAQAKHTILLVCQTTKTNRKSISHNDYKVGRKILH